ncbi:MAG: hypothetical protein M1368_03265 [Thaumarchaeota archaeon]|nr:hypothetical protein [Nitrososphaerota archaeon]
MSLIPPQLAAYSSIISILLLFADGLILGIATKKEVTSIVLIVVGLVLAGGIGLSIPFISSSEIMMHVMNIILSQVSRIGAVFYSFPMFWIIGFGLGLWKG